MMTGILQHHKVTIALAAVNADVVVEPIDCVALNAMLEAAKDLYTENCPGP